MTRRAKPGPEHAPGLRWAAKLARESARKWRRAVFTTQIGADVRRGWVEEATAIADECQRLAREAEGSKTNE